MLRRPARVLARLAAVLSLVVATLGPAPRASDAAPVAPPTAEAVASVYFRSSATFLERQRIGGGGFDWTTDGCSVPRGLRVSVPALAYVARTFAAPCAQHDFAYRNFGGRLRLDPSASRRLQVDRHFHTLLQARCGANDIRRARRVLLCRLYARLFYAAVRAFGSFG